MKKYKLRYLPIFYEELYKAVDYIAGDLQNPIAANKLLDETEAAILKRLEMPLAFEPVQSKRDRENPYYRIYVGNYTIYYVVIDDVMEVRRFIYGYRDMGRIL